MSVLVVEGGRSLRGHLVAPPDKSITHRALILAALGEGACRVAPIGQGRDNRATLGVLASLGVAIERDGPSAVVVHGVGGPRGLSAPSGPLDCMNSGTTMRMMSGVLAACQHDVQLVGDESLSRRPMTRLLALERMGAKLGGRWESGRLYAPLSIRGAELTGAAHVLEIPSAQVKSALLLAGLWAKGETSVREPMRSRDHTERMLRSLGAELRTEDDAIVVSPLTAPWRAPTLAVAPDLSSAAFVLGAALVTGSEALTVDTGVTPSRAGVLEVLERMGARLHRVPLGEVGGEPVERISVGATSALRGIEIAGELALRSIDELPLLAGLAAFAEGRTVIRDATELRVKESDRLAAISAVLGRFGATSTQTPDGLIIEGGRSSLHGCEVDGEGDHRIAMTAAVMGLAVRGQTRVHGAEHIEVSFPGFQAALQEAGAALYTVEPADAE